jgi:N-acetylglutamate synthase-like GNAT family acetyltransferase
MFLCFLFFILYITSMQKIIHRKMELILRSSEDKDIPAIRRLVNAFNKEIVEHGLQQAGDELDDNRTRQKIEEGHCFLLLKNNEIIGSILFKIDNLFTRRRTAYFNQLAINPALKGQGLGNVLMDYCEEFARLSGLEGAQVDTAKPASQMVSWYLQRGYKIVGETQWVGKSYESWVFEKSLQPIHALHRAPTHSS